MSDTCRLCGADFVARKPSTPEQAWCGEWFDHPDGRCSQRLSSVLIPSDELLAATPTPSEKEGR